jgi:hypothetical protein
VKKILLGLLILIMLTGTVVACARNESPAKVTLPDATYAHNEAAISWDGAITPPATITLPIPTVIMSGDSSKGGDYAYSSAQTTSSSDRMVIMNGYLTLVVDDVSIAMSQITALAGANGGFVISSSLQEDQNRLYASIAFRVDSAKYNETLAALHALAVDIRAESTSGQDVTEQYVDLSARLTNLEASEAQLLELMKMAGDVDDILNVQRELTNTRGQIEQIKGQMQYLEESSALALINVTLEQSKLTVEFNANTRTVNQGEAVQFYPSIVGGFAPYSYTWDFGDGETSTEANPSHAYHKSGNFTVTVKITDDKGNPAEYTRTDYITVMGGWSGGSVGGNAWNALLAFFRGVAAFFIWLGIFSPIWIAILIILYFAWWRRRKNRKQAQ